MQQRGPVSLDSRHSSGPVSLPTRHARRPDVARRAGAGHVVCRASVKQTPVPPPGRGGTWEKVINLFSELRGDTRGFTQRRRQRLGDVFKSAFYLQEYVFVDATSKAGKDVLNLEMQGKVGTAWPDSMKELLGPQGLLFQDGDAHTRLRKVSAPAFSKPFLRTCVPIVQDYTLKYLDKWAAAHPEPVALFPELKSLTLELNFAITLGGLTEQQKQTVMSSVDPWVEGLFLLPVPIFDEQRRKAFAARDRIKGVLSDAIADIRRRGIEKTDGTSLVANFLAAAESSQDEITDEMVLDSFLGFVFAGFSTTSSAAGCMLTHLARSPEARAAVAAEVASWPAAEREPRGPLDFDRLAQSPALESIVAETLRLSPPVLGFFRKAEADVELDGRLVKAGSRMFWGFDPANMDRDVYAQPKSFCPMRFVAAGAGGAGLPPPKPLSFGAGVHGCMGIDIAKLELKVLLVAMVRDAEEFSLAPGVKNEIAWSASLGEHPGDDLMAVVQKKKR